MRLSRTTPLLALLSGLFVQAHAILSISIDALKGPSCVIVDSSRSAQIPLAPFFTRVNVVVTDGLAQATMIQSFVNPLRHATEIAYVFPLPENGAVHAMSYELHDTLYRASIQERKKAQAIYDSIKSSGGQASILLQERPNIFQQKMANVRAGDTVHVEIQVSVPLKYVDGSWELAFPTMVGERFQSAGSPGAVGTISGWNPPADRDGPGLMFNVLVKGGSFDSISSPTHPVEALDVRTHRQKLARLGLVDSAGALEESYPSAWMLKSLTTYPNKDFVLRLRRATKGLDVVASSWKAPGRDTGYFHLAILPDLEASTAPRPPLDLVLLFDRSGSQMGWPLVKQQEIALDLLSRLAPTDRITVLAFDDINEYALGKTPVAASAANLAVARTFIQSMTARGGTQLLSAIEAALSTPISGDMQRLFIFLTDGFITNEAAILDTIANHKPQPQVLTFGCGGSLNRYFLESAASVGGGFATLLTGTEAAGPVVDAAWSRIESPQVNALRVDFGAMGAHDVVLPVSDRLYKGLPLVVDGKYLKGGRQTVTVRGQRSGQAWRLEREIDLTESSSTAWSIPKTWARSVIGRLELEEGTGSSRKDSIIKLSIAHQVLSKYTAFLATVGTPTEPGSSLSQAVKNSLVTEVQRREAKPLHAEGFRLLFSRGLLRILWAMGAKDVRIRILDLNGSVVRTIQPGASEVEASWNGMTDRGTRALPGNYVVEVRRDGSVLRQAAVWMP